MASNVADPVGLLSTQERLPLYQVFSKDSESIEGFAGALSGKNIYLPESVVVVAVGFLISIQIGVYKILDSRSDALYTE